MSILPMFDEIPVGGGRTMYESIPMCRYFLLFSASIQRLFLSLNLMDASVEKNILFFVLGTVTLVESTPGVSTLVCHAALCSTFPHSIMLVLLYHMNR